MKVFKLLSHPYTLIICFLFILISGEHWGGFYAMYLLMALSFGGTHALLGLAGIFILLVSFHWVKNSFALKQALNIIGVCLLVGSLFYFFSNDKENYNWQTFHSPIPLTTLIITAIVAACLLIFPVVSAMRKNTSFI